MKLTGPQLEEIKREVEKDVRDEIVRELLHMAVHWGNAAEEVLLMAAKNVREGNKIWRW